MVLEPYENIYLLLTKHEVHTVRYELSIQDMINTISATDTAFIISTLHIIVYWLNALDQSDFLQ